MRKALQFVAVIVLVAACGSGDEVAVEEAAPATAPVPAPVPAPPSELEPEPEPLPPTQEPVTLAGTASASTAPFDLVAGDYLATFRLDDDCLYYLHLGSVSDGARGQEIAYERKTESSENYLYGIPAGTYAVKATTSGAAPRCSWSVTLELLRLP